MTSPESPTGSGRLKCSQLLHHLIVEIHIASIYSPRGPERSVPCHADFIPFAIHIEVSLSTLVEPCELIGREALDSAVRYFSILGTVNVQIDLDGRASAKPYISRDNHENNSTNICFCSLVLSSRSTVSERLVGNSEAGRKRRSRNSHTRRMQKATRERLGTAPDSSRDRKSTRLNSSHLGI